MAASFAPGLRLGTSSASGNDFYVDFGLASTSVSGFSATSFQTTLNYQRAFSPTSNTSPFLNAGIGAMVLTSDSDTFTNTVVGVGLGVRSLVSQGHGAIRGEFRIDYIGEDSQGFAGGTAIGLKLGFDLYLK